MKTIELHFDIDSTCDDEPIVPDDEALLTLALDLAYRWIRIDWAGIVEVTLPVEDDVMFLAMAYAELDEFVTTGSEHRVFLGDGLLDVTALREDELIAMTVHHTPYLDARLTNSRLIKFPLAAYQRAWKGLMRQLLVQLQLAS